MPMRPALSRFAALIIIVLSFSLNVEKWAPRVQAARSSEVPSPSAERADRFGVYNWGADDTTFPNDGSTDRLNWSANKIAEIGSRTIRVTISTRDDYGVNPPGATDLVQIARSPAYDKLFRDPRFQTYLLTTYTLGDMASNWADGYASSEYGAERDEIKHFCEYLLTNPAFANKTFIILNWEGDNAIRGVANRRSAWDHYANWIRARADGVRLAKLIHLTSAVKLFSGLEFNTLKSLKTGQPCGAPVTGPTRDDQLQNRCVVDFVAPQVEVDYYSYSAWSSLQDKIDNPNESLKQRFKADLDFAMSKIRAQRPEITEHNFIIGEFGFERASYGECNAANYTGEMFDAFDGPDAFRVSYAIFWQIIDNRATFGVGTDLFGLYRARDGRLSLSAVGDTFRKRIAGEAATNYTGCPMIRRPPPHWGVLNPQGQPVFQINPDTVISIYAQNCCQNVTTPFSTSGNIVHFEQATEHFLLPRDNAQFFYESPTQINFSMPPARRTGWTRVYVTDARGFDSNEQRIAITCADCPWINDSCGVIDSIYQTRLIEPGGLISISGGRFSPSGNTVVIEQLEYPRTVRRWTAPRESVISESPAQIKVKLPDDLVPLRDTMLHVVDAQGLGSSEASISIFPRCQDCEPRLKPCQAMFPDAGGNFFAGAAVTIYGRFSASGNKVIIEQVDQYDQRHIYTLSQGSAMWSESDKNIRLALPILLGVGRATFYVIDAQGRETDAQEIVIGATPVTNVSAASYRGPNLAAESIVSAFGNSLAAITQAALSTPLPTEIAGARVIVKDSAGVERPAPLFFISPAQVNYQVPPGTATGAATIIAFNGSGSSSTGSVQIVNAAPGLFSANANGQGVAAAVVLRVKAGGTQVYEPVAAFNQAQNQFTAVPIDLGAPDDQVFLVLFGTGFRARSALTAIAATVGGTNVQVTFAGPHGTLVGLDQINLLLPRSLAGRGSVDVALNVDGLSANSVMVNFK